MFKGKSWFTLCLATPQFCGDQFLRERYRRLFRYFHLCLVEYVICPKYFQGSFNSWRTPFFPLSCRFINYVENTCGHFVAIFIPIYGYPHFFHYLYNTLTQICVVATLLLVIRPPTSTNYLDYAEIVPVAFEVFSYFSEQRICIKFIIHLSLKSKPAVQETFDAQGRCLLVCPIWRKSVQFN